MCALKSYKSWWDRELLSHDRLGRVFERLRTKALGSPQLLRSAPVHKEFPLWWILSHSSEVQNAIRNTLKDGSPEFDVSQLKSIFMGKPRDFHLASWPDRIVLNVMAQILTERLESLLGPHVFSFRKGMSNKRAIAGFCNFMKQTRTGKSRSSEVYVLKRDIAQYAYSIPHKKLMQSLLDKTDLGNSSIFYPLLVEGIRPVFRISKDSDIEACLSVGVAVGSPILPPLENFYLIPLDQAMAEIPNSFYCRYADDFLFASRDRSIVLHAEKRIDQIVLDLGLEVKPEKRLNLVLTSSGASERPDTFEVSSAIQWLGHRITVHSEVGPKEESYRLFRVWLYDEIRHLVMKIGRSDFEFKVKVSLLRKGLHRLFSVRTNPTLARFLQQKANGKVMRDIAKNRVQVLHRALVCFWKVDRRAAWRITRQVAMTPLGVDAEEKIVKTTGATFEILRKAA